jgi:scyllo-inosamine-4-phosphate amidinotransferase 1
MSVNSNTEWGTLKEVILGIVDYAQIPKTKKHDIHCVDYANYTSVSSLPAGSYPKNVIEETVEDLENFKNQLENIGIKVLRPEPVNYSLLCSTPNWVSDGYYSYCPRDSSLIIGDTIIETPMPLRSRYFETLSLKKIFKEYFSKGSKWISAPKPELDDQLYDRTDLSKPTLTDYEIAFDAANVIKCGKDIFYLVSNSGNRLGATWLQRTLGEKYTVHVLDNIYAYVHVDTTILPLAPGKVLLNPARVNDNNLPEYFKKWDKIWAADSVPTQYIEDWAPASPWLGMNVLSLSENLIAVEQNQTPLIQQLESYGFDVMPVQMRHSRTLSGGPHCVTLDTVRNDQYGDYS